MAIPDFSKLLDDAFNGNTQAVETLIECESINENELKEAINKIKECSLDGHPQQSFAFFFNALWHQRLRFLKGDLKNDMVNVILSQGSKAIELWAKAVDLGNTYAMRYLAATYSGFPSSLNPDYIKARDLLNKAITLGDPAASMQKVHLIFNNPLKFTDQDWFDVVSTCECEIGNGNVDAMILRARMHLRGQGAPGNHLKAIELFEKAIGLGYKDTNNELEAIKNIERYKNDPTVAICIGVFAKIDGLLRQFEQKVQATCYNSSEAKQKAYDLLRDLKEYTQTTKNLLEVDPKNLGRLKQLLLEYGPRCKAVIKDAQPILEQDLGWGQYIQNLGIKFLNLIVELFNTIAASHSWDKRDRYKLFTLNEASSSKMVREFEWELEPYISPPRH